MKNLAAILLLTSLAVAGRAQSAPAEPQTTAPQSAPANEDASVKKARSLLDELIQALGGQNYLNIRDMKQNGRTYTFYHGQPNGLGTEYWLFMKWPDKSRVELTKQRDVAYVLNGDTGYEITYKGTRVEDPEETRESIRNRHYSLDHVLRIWLKQPGVALFYDGTGIAEHKQVEKVTVLNAQNESVTVAIEIFSHLPVRVSYQIRDPKTRYFDEYAETFDGWRPEQGIPTAHTLTQYKNTEMARERFIQTVEYNTNLPDSLFAATPTYTPKKPR
jgi:hypothetical protein